MNFQLVAALLAISYMPGALGIEIVSTGKVGSTGDAYSSERESFVGSRCIAGAGNSVGVASASLYLDQSISQQQTESELGFAIGGRARYGVVEGSAAANFLSRSASNDFSIASIYSATYSFQNEKLTEPTLTAIGKSVSGNPERWKITCGSGYISEVKRGAKFFFSIKIDFRSQEEKQSFSAQFDVSGPAASVNGSLKRASEAFSKRTKVTVSVLQIGGDVDKVSGIFGNAAAGRAEYVECTLGTFEACAKVLQTALAYATDTASGFPSQLSDPKKRADLSYVVSNYEAAGIYEGPPPFFDQIVSLKRARLAHRFEEQYDMAKRLASLRNIRPMPPRSMEIEIASRTVDDNLRDIYAASVVCYDTPKACAASVDALQLTEIKSSVFELPSLESLCLYAFEPNRSKQRDFVMALAYVAGRLSKATRFIRIVDVCGGTDESTNTVRYATFSNIVDLSFQHVREMSGVQYRLEDISALQAGAAQIEQLDLRDHDIQKVDAVGVLSKVAVLKLSGNRIIDIAPLGELSRLEYLELARNNIRDPSSLSGLTSLSILSLADNEISDASGLRNLPRLQTLDLSGNQIQKIDGLLQLGSNLRLNLKGNKIMTLAGASASGAMDIDLSENPVPPLEVLEFCDRHPKVKVAFTAFPGKYGRFELTALGESTSKQQPYTCNPNL